MGRTGGVEKESRSSRRFSPRPRSHKPDREIKVGGPETLTHNEIATLAFEVLGIKPKITHIPNWVRVASLKLVRFVTGSKVYGPIEFFMTVMAMDMVAPQYGRHTLKAYFTDLT